MNLLSQIYHLMWADFLERVRRFSFVAAVGLALFAGYMFVPPVGAPYTSFVVASHRGFYNSAWIGTLYGATAAILLSLIGFYLVKNSLQRDYDTRVGQIIATTPLSRLAYMMGKWLSNLMVLTALLVVLSAVAPVMQLVRGEVSQIDLLAIWTPLWLMGFPALAFAAGVAVFFESWRPLRGGLGNIAYFFFWGPILVGSSTRTIITGDKSAYAFDFAGMSRVVHNISGQLAAQGVDIHNGIFGLIGPVDGSGVDRFLWNGMDWTAGMVLERLLWIGLGAVVVMFATLPFDRFDPARGRMGRQRVGLWERFVRRFAGMSSTTALGKNVRDASDSGIASDIKLSGCLTPVERSGLRARFLSIVWAELQLILRGRSWWWYLCALGLAVATPLVPDDKIARMLYAAASLWPILLWSGMGFREMKYRTFATVFSTPRPVWRQFPALWLAGVLVTAATASGFVVRLIVTGAAGQLSAVAVGMLFVPTLALAMGVWTRGSRAFEIIYLLWWYMSIQDGATVFDYRGATPEALATGVPFYYAAIAVVLLVLAFLGRMRQVREG